MASNGSTSQDMIFNTTKLVTFLRILVHREAAQNAQSKIFNPDGMSLK